MTLSPLRVALSFCVLLSACQCGGRLTAVPDGLRVDPASVDFGRLHPGGAVAAEVTLFNEGKRPLSLALRLEGDGRRTFQVSPVTVSLPAGTSRVIALEYVAAAAAGVDEASLVVAEGGAELPVALRGETVVPGVLEETPVGPADASTPTPDAAVDVPDAAVALPDASVPVEDAGVPDAGVCVPATCAALGRQCGSVADGCGGTVSCGGCGTGTSCDAAAGRCVCVPSATQEQTCSDGRDDDCDGLIDCVDPDCSTASVCAPTTCLGQGDVRVSVGTVNANAPDLAHDGTDFGVAWLTFDSATTGIDFAFARLSSQQQVVGAPVALTSDGSGAHPPRLAFNGEWAFATSGHVQASGASGNSIVVRRFTPAGAILGATQYGAGWPATLAPGAASGEFGVLWGSSQPMMTSSAVPTVSRQVGGQRLGLDFPLVTPRDYESTDYGDLTWDGSAWAAVWTAVSLAPSPTASVQFARLSASGTMLAAPRTLSTAYAASPRVIWTGSSFGVVWQELNASNRFEVRFVTLDAAGTPTGPTRTISQAPGDAMMADVTWTGARFVAVWTEQQSPAPTQVWLARLDAAGAPVGSPELVSCGTAAAWRPAVYFAAGKVAVAWSDSRHPSHLEIYARVLNP